MDAAGSATAPRRVLMVAPQPFYVDRGTPIAVRYVLEALSRLGYAVDLLTYPVGSTVAIPGVTYHRCANPLRFRSVAIGLSPAKVVLDGLLTAKLLRMLRRNRYDAIHAVEEMAFPVAALARARGIPVIYDMQSSLPEQLAQHRVFRSPPVRAALRGAERWLLERSDLVVSSTGLAATVQDLVPAARVREWAYPSLIGEAPAGDVVELRRSLGIAPDARIVLYCGTFEEYQGLDNLIAAAASIHRRAPDAVFVLVGGSEERARELARLGSAQGMNGNLRVLPRRPRCEIPAFLAAAEVLVSPRNYGGNLPLKVFDYLAAARPIVATDIPTHREVLDGSRAVLVPPSPEGLEQGIMTVLDDAAEATRVAAGARAYAEQRLGWERFVETIRELYEGVCARSAR